VAKGLLSRQRLRRNLAISAAAPEEQDRHDDEDYDEDCSNDADAE